MQLNGKMALSSYTVLVLMSMVHVLHSQSCTMVRHEDRKGKDTTEMLGFTPTDDACNALCLDSTECLAAVRSNANLCLYWTDEGEIIDSPGDHVFIKSCDSGTTPAAPESTTKTTAATCTMDSSANTDASNFVLKLSDVSAASCEKACQFMVDCEYYVFIQSSTKCSLYNTQSVTKSSQSGHMTGQKKSCSNGAHCCFETTADQTITDLAVATLTPSQASCESLCLAVGQCRATSFTDTTCKVFTSSPAYSTAQGVTMSTKDCTEEVSISTGSFTYSDKCSSTATPMKPLFALHLLAIGAAYLYLPFFW